MIRSRVGINIDIKGILAKFSADLFPPLSLIEFPLKEHVSASCLDTSVFVY